MAWHYMYSLQKKNMKVSQILQEYIASNVLSHNYKSKR